MSRELRVSIVLHGEEAARVRQYCLMKEVPMTLFLKQCALMGLVENGVIEKKKIIQPTKKPDPKLVAKAEKALLLWELTGRRGKKPIRKIV